MPTTGTMVKISFLGLLVLLTVSFVLSSGPSCPISCVCRTRRVPKLGETLFVNCKGRGFTKVPDLSRLSINTLPKRLDLGRNQIRSISQSDFPRNLNIAMLFLESNVNLKMAPDALKNLDDSLQYLGLQSIHLQFTSPFTFLRGLGTLEKLILNYNPQRDDGVISNNVFKNLGLNSLKEVSMYNCRIGGMESDALVGLEHIEELDLTFNWLREVPPAIKVLKNLKKIHLQMNNIKRVRYMSFAGMHSLTELVLNDNAGVTIEDQGLAGLETSLTSLSLRSCELDDVPTSGLKGLRSLLHLDIGYNPLVDMTEKSLKGSYCLQSLDLSKTLVPLQPDILKPQQKCIITLFLNQRGLTDVPRDFLMSLSKLNHVSLNNNEISVLKTDSLQGLNARGFDFFDNPLIKVETGAFEGIGPHISLGIKRTNITNLNFVLDYKEKTFDHIWLEGTKIPCDCSLYEVMQRGEPWMLEGQCTTTGDPEDLKDPEFKKNLKTNCTETGQETRYSEAGESNIQESVVDKNHVSMVIPFLYVHTLCAVLFLVI